MDLGLKVIARTFEVDSKLSDEDLFTFGGKMAGVCYMPEDYFDSKIQDEAKANNRANNNVASGHHSVFDHANITFQISGLPKIMAMLLNSTEQYTTSEKSARYTVMQPETELELDIYNKWKDILKVQIATKYSDRFDDKTITKLAQENARYLISVFTPTHMTWTTSYRQVAYVIGWLGKLYENTKKLDGEFNRKLADWCLKLKKAFESEIGAQDHILDNKAREFEFFTIQSYNQEIVAKDIIADVYQVTYLASFAQLAQLQRHRTIHYEMQFDGKDAHQFGVYVPPIIAGTELEAEWKADFEKVAYCYPQGTLVKVLEQGRAIKFFEKCKERLCGRAQLETMRNTVNLMQRFIDNRDNLSNRTQVALDKVTVNGKVASKCMMQGIHCGEKCTWGGLSAFDRLI